MTHDATAAHQPRRQRPRAFLFSQMCALLLAMYVGWHSYKMVDADRLDIDRALLWIAAALLMLAYFAWDGSRPRLAAWPRSVAGYVRAHPIELLLLAAILAIGVFVRLFRYGTLPPSGYIYLEEHITGGVGWEILQGDRRFAYPLVMYSGALGQWLFGPSTFGLRSMTIAANIVLIIPFYLMMREVVERPAALFATAIFASLRVFQDTASQASPGALATVVMVWTFLRGLRTGNAIWFIPMAVCAADLFYEYETFKAAPFLALPFVAFFALRALLWPLPANLASLWMRARRLAPRAIKPVVVTAVVILIGIGPMVAQTHRGQHIFFSSLERQKADRTQRGTPGLFSPDAAEQLKWSVQVFTPVLKAEFPLIGPVPTRGTIDNITSMLLWASMIAALLTFWRGSRALFLSWFVGGLLFASLLLSNFAAWKVAGFLVPGVVLIGFLADDVFALARRRSDRMVLQAIVGCAAIVAGVLFLNLRALNANANDQNVVKEWANTPSQLYSICDHLRDRPSDNYAYVEQRVRDSWGFTNPPGDPAERRAAWSDWKFGCWGLRGETIANLQEAWPLYRPVDGPVSLIATIAPAEVAQTVDAVQRAIPGAGEPDRRTTAPGGLFSTLSFAVTSEQLNARRGLAFRLAPPGGATTNAVVVPGPAFSLPAGSGGGAFTLSGLVFVPRPMEASLVPVGGSGSPAVAITVDGQPSYDAAGAETPQSLVAGWHLVQLRGQASGDVTMRLRWHARDGSVTDPGQNDFYAVEDLAAWKHTRTYSGVVRGEAVRFDFYPHYSNFEGIRVDATHTLPPGTQASEDRWEGRWTVESAGTYTISVGAYNQTFKMTIDGKDVLSFGPPHPDGTAQIPLTSGDHSVKIVFSNPPASGRIIGGRPSAPEGRGKPVARNVHPF